MLDLVHEGDRVLLAIREAVSGATETRPRLAAIAARYREAMPVRITRAEEAQSPDASVRTLLAGGEELLTLGDVVVRSRHGAELARSRAPWLERAARRARIAWQRWRTRHYGDGAAALARNVE